MRVRLTPAIVAKAKPGPSRVYLWDTEVPGLGLVVQPSGSRSWVFQGAASGGRRVTVRATELRDARKAALGIVAGSAPLDTSPKHAVRTAEVLMVSGLLDAWLNALAARPRPPVSLSRIKACMENHVRPRIGHVAFSNLSRAHLLALRDALAARGLRGMANQVIAYVRAAIRWAEDARVIPEAPRWRVPRLRLGSRAQSLTDDQWAHLLAHLEDRSGGLHPVGRLALLALTLTGCRKGEIATLRWSDIGPEGLSLQRHKTSAHVGPKHVPAQDRLTAVFAEAREVSQAVAKAQPTAVLRDAILTSPYVFPSIARNGLGKPIRRCLDDTWKEVRHRANLPPSMTIHGLRGAFITQAQRLGVPLATVAAIVGHESPLTTLRHYTAPSRREVAEGAQRVADWISCNRTN